MRIWHTHLGQNTKEETRVGKQNESSAAFALLEMFGVFPDWWEVDTLFTHHTLRSVTLNGHVKYVRNSLACKMQEDSACNTTWGLSM